MTSPFGLYIIVESDLSNHAIDRAIAHTEKTQPRDVLVMSGGQYDRAMQVCERVRMVAPKTRITYRKYPNDGAIKLFGYNGASLYAAHVRPLLSWLKQHKILYHLDNESVQDDMRPYSDATALALTMADTDGIGLSVASFATGNPAERHYAQLDSMWRGLAASPLSIWAPHEYIGTTPQESGGHVYRFKEGWKRCDQLGVRRPQTCIQEYGLLIKYDPEAGWRRTSLSGKAYADELISYYNSWYKPDNVSVCVYAYCGMDEKNSKWKDCSVDDDSFLKAIEGYVTSPPALPPQSPPIPTPPEQPVTIVPPPAPPPIDAAPVFSGSVSVPADELRAAMALLSAARDAWIAMAADFRQRADLLDTKVKASNVLLDSWNTRLREAA